jgi:hypothetical protein
MGEIHFPLLAGCVGFDVIFQLATPLHATPQPDCPVDQNLIGKT